LENNVLKNRRTSLVVTRPTAASAHDGRVSARVAAGRRPAAPLFRVREATLQDRCIAWPAASPPYQPTVYNNNVQIVQTPNYVVLLSEMIHTARIVRTDGSAHGAMRSLYGDSRGRWDGNTLVVDTINFNGRLNFRGTGEDLHLIERFTRTGADTLEYHYTVDDRMSDQSWTVRLDMTRIDGPIRVRVPRRQRDQRDRLTEGRAARGAGPAPANETSVAFSETSIVVQALQACFAPHCRRRSSHTQ
jgi:hypothetical protein